LVQPARPSPDARDAWPSYAAIAAVGYVVYGVGAVSPYLRAQLGLTDAEVGLHSSAMAIGFVLSGVLAAAFDRRLGEVTVRGAGVATLVVAVLVLAAGPALAATLGAALLVGLGAGTLLGYANALLARPGGRAARLRVARANVWAMVSAFVCPVVLATASGSGLPWGLGLLPALGLLVVVALDLRAGPRLVRVPPTSDRAGLPVGFWFAWLFLVSVIAVEFSIVFWGATLVERQTGTSTEVATLLGGLFLGGMFVGRLGQSLGLGTGGDIRRSAAIGVVLAGTGAAIAWVSTVPAVSGAALFLAGLGVAGLYPLGVAAALAAAPGRLTLAGTRVTLASGAAILLAPLTLGAAADAAGVPVAWGLVVALSLVALALVAVLPAGAPVDAATEDAAGVVPSIG
jgi:MFS family permease